MKIVVVGGSGLTGATLVKRLRMHGHEALSASPSSGVNTITGAGLDSVLRGSEAVIDVTNSRSFDDTAMLEFFETSTRNLLIAEAAAEVKHHVILSVVGADHMPDSGYMRAKIAQENMARDSAMPFTIVRATQYFEFLGSIANASADQGTVRLAPALIQPVAVDDVAEILIDVAIGAPANNTLEAAGPERFRLDELIRQYLQAARDARKVVTDPSARYFGAKLEEHTLTPGSSPRIGSTRFEQWLDRNSREVRSKS